MTRIRYNREGNALVSRQQFVLTDEMTVKVKIEGDVYTIYDVQTGAIISNGRAKYIKKAVKTALEALGVSFASEQRQRLPKAS